MSEKIDVFMFQTYDIKTDKFITSKNHATLDFIKKYGMQVIVTTKKEVLIDDLDGDGFFAPNKSVKRNRLPR